MTTDNSTRAVRGSELPIVSETIRHEIETWYGSSAPDPEARESISAEAFESILSRIANAAIAADRMAPKPSRDDAVEFIRSRFCNAFPMDAGRQFSALLDAMRPLVGAVAAEAFDAGYLAGRETAPS
jgi:hypothetical protein